MIYEKVSSRRTIRKFLLKTVPENILLNCVDAARLSPSGANRQPLKYVIVNDKGPLKEIFNTLSWAGYLPSYFSTEEFMPRAYIVILLDKNIREDPGHDAGIAAMSISMVAYDEGLGSCIIGAIDRIKLREVLKVPNDFDIVLVIALGYSAENPRVDVVKNEDVRYWLDEDGILHVPKRDLKKIVTWNTFKS